MNEIKELLSNNLNRTLFDIKAHLEDMRSGIDKGRGIGFRDKYGSEYFGYENQAYAAVMSLISNADEEDETTIAELMNKDSEFSVVIIEHDDSIFYDLNCSGFDCSLADIFDLAWYEDDWRMIEVDDHWDTRSNHYPEEIY